MIREPPIPFGLNCSLFLDIDGTLLDFAPTPDAVRVDEALRALLRALERKCDGALALISGRTIPDIDELFDPLFLPVAGVHGCERRDGFGYWRKQIWRSPEFDGFCARLSDAFTRIEGVLVEDKGCGVALHYRQAPHLHSALLTALDRMETGIPSTHRLVHGDHVIEFRPKEHDKGSAIDSFLGEAPFTGRFPIFIGDDTTDRDGFEAVRNRGGWAIAVGNQVDCEWNLPGPEAVKRWLVAFLVGRKPS